MNYFYDTLINLQDKYLYFYEWDSNDEFLNISKILIINIDTSVLTDFMFNKVSVDKEFLEMIINKTKLRNNKTISYMCIITDSKNALIVEFDKFGKSIFKSSLLLDDEINVCELAFDIDKTEIKYEILEKDLLNDLTVQQEKIKKVIKLEIKKCNAEQNYNKLKFLFIEWFGYLEKDINKIIEKMNDKLNNDLSEKEYKIYKIIKMSYNNV